MYVSSQTPSARLSGCIASLVVEDYYTRRGCVMRLEWVSIPGTTRYESRIMGATTWAITCRQKQYTRCGMVAITAGHAARQEISSILTLDTQETAMALSNH